MCGTDLLKPSEYTGLLIQAIRMRADKVRGADALEIGTGSGVVLQVLARLGAARVSGVDIEPEAVRRARAVLDTLPGSVRGTVRQGDMWEPFGGRRFDLVVANLPHFPAESMNLPGRLPSWSTGGPDGRALLDRLLDGLPAHLAEGGLALLTHNGFIDVERSKLLLADKGLWLRPLLTTMVHISGAKLAALSADIQARSEGLALQQYGNYLFGEVHVVEISRTPYAVAGAPPSIAMARD